MHEFRAKYPAAPSPKSQVVQNVSVGHWWLCVPRIERSLSCYFVYKVHTWISFGFYNKQPMTSPTFLKWLVFDLTEVRFIFLEVGAEILM